jgi:hypothetical protein
LKTSGQLSRDRIGGRKVQTRQRTFPNPNLLEELARRKVIMIGCDLHDKAMLLKVAVGREEPETRLVKNTAPGRKTMIADLLRRAKALGGSRIVFAYGSRGQAVEVSP